MRHLLVFIFALFLSFTVSCSKDEVEGPQGAQGIEGEQGPKGDQGDKGEQGNANVQVFAKSISSETWETVGSYSKGHLRLTINVPVLTSDVIDDSVILIYVKSSDFSYNWAILPYHSERDVLVNADIKSGKVILKRSQGGKASTQSNFTDVRIVIIEPSESTDLSASTLDFGNYDAVEAYYGL